MKNKIFFLLLIMFSFVSFMLSAEKLRYNQDLNPVLSSSSEISMVTVYPGHEVYSMFGHSSFRVLDPENGIDWMFNYGTFDFDDPLFVPKFVAGKLDYYLDVNDFQRSVRFYSVYERRKVVEQVLDLDFEQRTKVFEFLMENSRYQNRFYKYDFIWDNCSTRISDVIIKCFGEDAVFREGREDVSFRNMIAAYLRNYPFLSAGIELLLGSPADKRPEGIETFFLPLPMIDGFDNAVLYSGESSSNEEEDPGNIISNAAMTGKSLVREKSVLSEGSESIRNVLNYPLLIFTAAMLLELTALLLILRKGKIPRVPGMIFNFIEALFLFAAGITGSLIFYLWFLSDHNVTNWNFHILWVSPLSLVFLITLFFNKLQKMSVFISRFLLISSILFTSVLFPGIQSLSYTLLPLYMFFILMYFRRSEFVKSGDFNIKIHRKSV